MFVPGKPFKLNVVQQSSLLGPFLSYGEIEVLWTRPQPRITQNVTKNAIKIAQIRKSSILATDIQNQQKMKHAEVR